MPQRADFADGRDYNKAVVEEFRANRGQVTGDFAGRNLLLLTTAGAKSGRAHVTPLGYSFDGDRLVVSAAAGGAPHHPDWYHNLVANPIVTVELGLRRLRLGQPCRREPSESGFGPKEPGPTRTSFATRPGPAGRSP